MTKCILPIQPKPNIVIDIKGLSAEQLEEKMNDLEARHYHHSYGPGADGLMLFRYFEPRPVPDLGETMELIAKTSRKYLAWHKAKGLTNRATKALVEYFVRRNHLAYPDGSPITTMELRMIYTNVNLILRGNSEGDFALYLHCETLFVFSRFAKHLKTLAKA